MPCHKCQSIAAMPDMTANVDTTTCTTPALGKSHLSVLVVVGNGRYDIMPCCSFHAGHATWDTCDFHLSGILVTANVDTTTCTTPALGKGHLSVLVVVGNGRYDIMPCCLFHAGHATWDTCDCHVSSILAVSPVACLTATYDIMPCCSFHAGHATSDTCDCHLSGILATANVDTTTCTTPALGKGHLSVLVVVGNGRYDIVPCCLFHAGHATSDTCDCHVSSILAVSPVACLTATSAMPDFGNRCSV
jgi:hypothetical protein